jgi:hypothetical protein
VVLRRQWRNLFRRGKKLVVLIADRVFAREKRNELFSLGGEEEEGGGLVE